MANQELIIGSEMEWAHMVKVQRDGGVGPYENLDEVTLQQHINTYVREQGELGNLAYLHFLSGGYGLGNGGRFYNDHGHAESSTPEDTSIKSLISSEEASEFLIYDFFSHLKSRGFVEDFLIYNRVADPLGHTWGYHENYGSNFERIAIDKIGLRSLGAFLAVRGIFTGAGILMADGQFVMSQKASHATVDYSVETVKEKPIVNLRDQPLVNKRYNPNHKRIHIVCGDPNISRWAKGVKFGTTSSAIKLIEYDMAPQITFRKPLFMIAREVAADLAMSKTFEAEYKDYKSLSALNVHEIYFQQAQKLQRRGLLNDEETVALKEWEKAHADATVDPEKLFGRADWMTGLKMLQRKPNYQRDPSSEEARAEDRKRDLVEPDNPKNYITLVRDKVFAKNTPPEFQVTKAEVEKRRTTPPSTTRAAIRGAFTKEFSADPDYRVDWNSLGSLTFQDGSKTVRLDDPFDIDMSKINQFKEAA
jgi:proteasome accessory factor A